MKLPTIRGAGMIIRKFVLSLWLLLVLSACASSKLSPQTVSTVQTYYAQSVTVTPAQGFSAGITFGRSTPDELAGYFANEVQTGLEADLKKTLQGSLPAAVSVILKDIHTGPSVFMSPTTTVNATVTITDIGSGATVVQFPVTIDNSELQNKTNADPIAGAAAKLILVAVVDTRNLTLWNLARTMRHEIKVQLGSKSLF